MRLGVHYIIILFACSFLVACAEVGTISGGPKDEIAPKPIEDKINPPNGTTNFSTTQIEIPFREFIRLNEPGQTIRLVPPHAKVSAHINRKALVLSIDGNLEENTTYAVYLNNTVQDITEKNDTIIKYVFSTGNDIDSLSYTCFVADAWSNAPKKNIVVAVYSNDSTLISFAETDSKGRADLNYLKKGNYLIYAFEDENKDLFVQDHEKIAFPSQPSIQIEASNVDSIPFRLYSPLGRPRISNIKSVFPGVITMKGSRDLRGSSFFINGLAIPTTEIKWHSTDSVSVFPKLGEDHPEVIVHSAHFKDTLLVRMLSQEKNTPITFKAQKSKFTPWDTLRLLCNDFISAVTKDSISVISKKDSSALQFTVSSSYNELLFNIFNRDSVGDIIIDIAKGAVNTKNGFNEKYHGVIELPNSSKYGTLVLDLKYYQEPIIVIVVQGNRTISSHPTLPTNEKFKIDGVSPGEYSFIVVRDTNSNRVWDVGNKEQNIQPESLDRFTETVKVRANWEIEVSLMPKNSP